MALQGRPCGAKRIHDVVDLVQQLGLSLRRQDQVRGNKARGDGGAELALSQPRSSMSADRSLTPRCSRYVASRQAFRTPAGSGFGTPYRSRDGPLRRSSRSVLISRYVSPERRRATHASKCLCDSVDETEAVAAADMLVVLSCDSLLAPEGEAARHLLDAHERATVNRGVRPGTQPRRDFAITA